MMAFPTPLLDQKLAQIRQQSEGDRQRLLQSAVDREVDVVPLDQCHFADKIRQTGIQWTSSKSQD